MGKGERSPEPGRRTAPTGALQLSTMPPWPHPCSRILHRFNPPVSADCSPAPGRLEEGKGGLEAARAGWSTSDRILPAFASICTGLERAKLARHFSKLLGGASKYSGQSGRSSGMCYLFSPRAQEEAGVTRTPLLGALLSSHACHWSPQLSVSATQRPLPATRPVLWLPMAAVRSRRRRRTEPPRFHVKSGWMSLHCGHCVRRRNGCSWPASQLPPP